MLLGSKLQYRVTLVCLCAVQVWVLDERITDLRTNILEEYCFATPKLVNILL